MRERSYVFREAQIKRKCLAMYQLDGLIHTDFRQSAGSSHYESTSQVCLFKVIITDVGAYYGNLNYSFKHIHRLQTE